MLNIDSLNIMQYNIDRINDDRNKDLLCFLAYLVDLSSINGVTIHFVLVSAGLDARNYYNVQSYLRAKNIRKPFVSLNLLLQLGRYWNYPFDSSKYFHLLKSKEEAQKEHLEREKLKQLENY